MNLSPWLRKLAAVCSAEPKEFTIEAYLEELVTWKLTDEQWEELRRRAAIRHRFPGKLPMLSELDDIRRELIQEAHLRAENERRMRRPDEDAVPMPPEIKAQIQKLFRVK